MQILSFFTKILHFFPPEISHSVALYSLKLMTKFGVAKFFIKTKSSKKCKQIDNYNKDSFLNQFPNNLGIAAGLDKNGDFIDSLASLGIGFIELGTVTPRPQQGNNRPRLFRDKKNLSLINRMGFNNKGVDHLIKKVRDRKSFIPLGISIGKNFDTPLCQASQDYLACLDKVYEHAAYIAINISSPNTANLRDLSSKDYFDNLLAKIKKLQLEKSLEYGYRPLFIKISPDEGDQEIKDICDSIKKYSIDGIICSNTTTNHSGQYGAGGLSGNLLKDPSTAVQKKIRNLLSSDFMIIASGGVMSARDYNNKIAAGADLVQIYTGFIFQGPKLILDIIGD